MSIRLTAAGASLLTAAATLGVSPADAHHSIQAVVDTATRLQAEMVLTKVDWINPHAWFHFTLTKADGSVTKDVPIEWLSLGAMRQAGIQGPEDFTIGGAYRVTYNPNRDGTIGGEIVSLVDTSTGQVFSRGGGQNAPQPPIPSGAPATRINY